MKYLLLILIILGLFFRKSKILTILDYLFIIYNVGTRTSGVDFDVYRNEYLWSAYSKGSDVRYIGFYYVEKFAHSLGFTLNEYLLFMVILSCSIFFIGLIRVTDKPNAALSLFFIYPFGHEAVQTRTFLADSIIVFSLYYLFQNKNENNCFNIKNICIYFILAFLASSIHFLAAIYIIVGILYIFLSDKFREVNIVAVVTIIYLLIVTNILPRMIINLNPRIGYYISAKTGIGMLIPIFITIIMYFLNLYIKSIIKYSLHIFHFNLKTYLNFIDLVIIILPLFCYDVTFTRMLRVFLIVEYIVFSKVLFLKGIGKNNKVIISLMMIFICSAFFFYENEFEILLSFMK